MTVDHPNLPTLPDALVLLAQQLQNLSASPHWQRVVQPVMPTNTSLLAWLANNKGTRLYWRSRDSDLEVATVGVATRFIVNRPSALSECQRVLQDILKDMPTARVYGGMAFSPQTSDHWPGFPGGELILPRFELVRENSQLSLVCNICFDGTSAAERERQALLAGIPACISNFEFPAPLPDAMVMANRPDRRQWNKCVDEALGALERGDITKVVLARQRTLALNDELCPWSMLSRWQALTPKTYGFCYTSKSGEVFFGASPERLYQRRGCHLASEAMAGTTRRGANPQEDEQLAEALRHDDKNLWENALVSQAICEALEECSEQVEVVSDVELVKLQSIQHLRQTIHATLNPHVSDAELLTLLHPTPAVGGVPKKTSMALIEQLEGYPRGWYAGPFGYVGDNHAEFAVAIRSARLKDRTLRLYSGVGLVQGSCVEDEWQELDSKLWTVQSLFESGL